MKVRSAALILVASGALLGGCAYPEPYPVYDTRPVVEQRTEYGVVESIEMYRNGGGSHHRTWHDHRRHRGRHPGPPDRRRA